MTEVDLFISTQRIKVLNADTQVPACSHLSQWDYSNIDSPACKVAIPWCWTAVTCVLGSGNLTGMARELRKETHTYRTSGISGPDALMQMNQRQPRNSVCLFSMSEQGNSRRSL